MIIIHIKLHDILRNKAKLDGNHFGFFQMEVKSGLSVRHLLKLLGLDDCWVGLVIINKKQVDFQSVIEDGDKIEIFSPMSGG